MSTVIPQKYLDFLSRIYLLRKLTITRLRRELEMDYKTMRNIFLSLSHKYKIHFWVDVLQQKLGLGFTLLILKKVKPNLLQRHDIAKELLHLKLPFVRSISLTLDGGLQIVFQNPLNSKLIIDEGTEVNVKAMYSFNFVLRSKPLPNLLQSYVKGDFNYLTEKGLEEAFEHKYKINEEYLLEPARFDGLDLVILDVIESRPYITLRTLTNEVNKHLSRSFTVAQIERHVEKHVENLVLGYRMANVSFTELSNYGSILVTSCSNCIDFCSRAISHPFIYICVGNTGNGLTGITVVAPRDIHSNFVISLNSILTSYGCEEAENIINYFIVRPYYMLYGVPRPYPAELRAGFDVEVEYDPRSRSWVSEINLSRVVEVLRKSL
ncbi:hypothetical protein QPL79_07085 [Ignisphaera sp. 4213-co]|uniref:Uncharacterized protein n=1 Tax=Ignisphaera cupida TaxID=3050454 RepID=A0ABD4ZAK4_9CREN|nr:hypothetical protein [Ignisphaera sp. 4213-co]MDK6029123.1 hypothetical protein [Ignisphaera sp. 4213-co]